MCFQNCVLCTHQSLNFFVEAACTNTLLHVFTIFLQLTWFSAESSNERRLIVVSLSFSQVWFLLEFHAGEMNWFLIGRF
jgi:hypothetical protein